MVRSDVRSALEFFSHLSITNSLYLWVGKVFLLVSLQTIEYVRLITTATAACLQVETLIMTCLLQMSHINPQRNNARTCTISLVTANWMNRCQTLASFRLLGTRCPAHSITSPCHNSRGCVTETLGCIARRISDTLGGPTDHISQSRDSTSSCISGA